VPEPEPEPEPQASKHVRGAAVAANMELGARETYEQLEALLATIEP